MDYEKDIKTDPSALDVEWLQQASLVLKYGKISTYLENQLEALKEELAVIKAELDKKIREDPEKFGLDTKLTETLVANTIIQQDSVKQMHKKIIDCSYEYKTSQVALRALDAKRSALENLVKLHGQYYFAGPSIPRDLSKEWEQKQRQGKSNENIAKAMNRNK